MLKIKNIFRKANWVKTIIFNFKMLPLADAIHFPILLHGKVDISKCTGRISWLGRRPHFAGWNIGGATDQMQNYSNSTVVTRIQIQGILNLGESGIISNGTMLSIGETGTLNLHDNVFINLFNRIVCVDEITIGSDTIISWECQFLDSDFHYSIAEDGTIHRCSKPIFIGQNSWIGNRVTIGKGVYLNDESIIASNSFVNKNFSAVKNGMFGGIPAKVLKTGYKRVTNYQQQDALNEYFASTKVDSISIHQLLH